MNACFRYPAAALLLVFPQLASAASGPTIGPIPVDFILFALTLLGVAMVHGRTLQVALIGLVVITLYKIGFSPFPAGPGLPGLLGHLAHEWVLLANLLLLLVGFALLSKHFEDSRIPAFLPRLLADDWKGGFGLLVMIFVLSSFLDNIAAALIGGTIARVVFRGKVHIGYLAAIVAASNAGGSGSVVGDTTTTMMWIDGVSPLAVVEAYVAAGLALVLFGIPAAFHQQRHSPIIKDPPAGIHADWVRVFIVALMLVAAVGMNVYINLHNPELGHIFPFLGVAVWVVLLVCAPLRKPAWAEVPGAFRGAIFLLALVLSASMMPVEKLPPASWPVAFSLGFISAVFDNIPLTALALHHGGYDWGFLAFAVGFGGSMLWFGSSAGVALTSQFPEGRSVVQWVKAGWPIALAYVISFFFMLVVVGWHPDVPHTGVPSAEHATPVQPNTVTGR